MAKILVVEDENSIAHLLKLSLTKAGHMCTCALDGKQAADLLEQDRFDLVLLDIMLPEIDGLTLLEYIRPMEIPVIFITAKGETNDKIRGLKAGAEDYIVKPFEVVELLARVDVVLRRFQKAEAILHIGDLQINVNARRVLKQNDELHLTPKEYDLLVLFAQNPGRALYRETIYERVWGKKFPYGSKTVDLHVQRLRKKVGWQNCLHTINKVGYRLEV